MNKKAMVEKHNALLDEIDALYESGVVEVRSLTQDEENKIEELRCKADTLKAEIEKEEERSLVDTTKVEERKEEIIMEDNRIEVEKRGLEQYMRGIDGEELRTMNVSGGSALIPTHLHGEVVKKLEEVAPLFAMIPKLTPVAGSIEVLKETNIGTAAFVGDASNISLTDYTMSKVKLEQKRCGSAVELSQNLINDAGIDIVEYTKDVLYRRLGHALDKAIVNGNGSSSFQGLNQVSGGGTEIETATSEGVTIEDFMNVMNAMDPTLQAGAVWVMSREVFNKLALLKDGAGNFYMTRQLDVVNNRPVYRLLGCPIFINSAVEAFSNPNKVAYLVNFEAAYKGMIKKDMELKHISGDTANALKGTHTFTLDIYADAKIVQDAAIRALKVSE